MCTPVSVMDVLPADREAGNSSGSTLEERRGHAQGDFDVRILTRGIGNRPHLLEIGRKAVHFPIAGDELRKRHILPLFRRPSGAA
jgi:hypothetical protein